MGEQDIWFQLNHLDTFHLGQLLTHLVMHPSSWPGNCENWQKTWQNAVIRQICQSFLPADVFYCTVCYSFRVVIAWVHPSRCQILMELFEVRYFFVQVYRLPLHCFAFTAGIITCLTWLFMLFYKSRFISNHISHHPLTC